MQPERQRDRLERCQRAVEEEPDRAANHYNLGLALTVSGRVKQAEDAYLRAVELDPDLVQAWVNLGGVRMMRWDFDGCLEANRRAVEIEPECTQAHFNMGQAYLYKNEPERLLDCNRRVLELDREHAAAHYFSAVAALALDNLAVAERHLGRAMELGHTPPPDFVKAMEKAQMERTRGSGVTVFEITGTTDPDRTKED
jgi:tetratricopeptide (TPR) repeat protein